MNYYCLIAGLPDIHHEDSKTNSSLAQIKSELLEQLTPSDARLLQLIFASYDNSNFLAFLKNKESQLNPLGNLNHSDWEQLLNIMQESENPKDDRLLPYIINFYNYYTSDKRSAEITSAEDYLASLYYAYALKNSNQFLSSWFEFCLNVNNLLTAVACRKYDFDLRPLIVGDNEIASVIKSSNARDFGLSGVFDQPETALRIAEENDLLEREKKIDGLKWAWLEENTFFNYFGIEKVLAYTLKIEMLERWNDLSVENGTQIFRELLDGLKQAVKFETM